MQKLTKLYSGKAKSVYETDQPQYYIMEFRDDISAFNAEKLASLNNKGFVNNQFNAFIMQTLAHAGIKTHFLELFSENESVVKALQMIPVECVIRNIAAGNLCKRLGLEEGIELTPPTFEFFYKHDKLGDPFINEYHIRTFNWASEAEINAMQTITFQINDILRPLFLNAGMLLVDFKLEFGRCNGELYLGDEFTPDGCRIWDAKTREKLDKDRFRRDLGDVVESYQIAAQRLGIELKK